MSLFFNKDLSLNIKKEIKKIVTYHQNYSFLKRKFCQNLDAFVALKKKFHFLKKICDHATIPKF